MGVAGTRSPTTGVGRVATPAPDEPTATRGPDMAQPRAVLPAPIPPWPGTGPRGRDDGWVADGDDGQGTRFGLGER